MKKNNIKLKKYFISAMYLCLVAFLTYCLAINIKFSVNDLNTWQNHASYDFETYFETDENGEGSNTPTESQSNSQQATASNNGNKQRPDVINSVTGAVRSLTHIGSKAKTFVSEKAHDVTNKARDIVVDQFEGMKIQRDYENTVQEFSNINDKENITESDKIIVQTVMQMAQTATSDGEVTSQDIQAINNQINLITDANIKRKIKNSIVPMLNRVNTKSTTDANGDQNKKSGLVGKILMGVKLGFNVILKPIKTFIRLAFFTCGCIYLYIKCLLFIF